MKQISVDQAAQLLQQRHVKIFDLRDEGSFHAGHIEGAERLTQDNLINHVRDQDLSQPMLVYCYHGISSEAAAEFLSEQGFEEVYSLIGGFEAWRAKSTTKDSDE